MSNTKTPAPHSDDVIEASEESFPASDPPAFVSTTGSTVKDPARSGSNGTGSKKKTKKNEGKAESGRRGQR
jgi:hypothetical protein